MNPYGPDLGDREPLDALEFVPRDVQELLGRAGPEVYERPLGAGKWTVGQVLLHLAQTELAFGMRFRLALSTPSYVVQPFDQDAWLAREPETDGREALGAWLALRRMNLALFRSFSAEERARTFHHPERGDLTIWDYVETLAGHDVHHLVQLQALVGGPPARTP
jgi:uncharacterized damage-inducible protein DinB